MLLRAVFHALYVLHTPYLLQEPLTVMSAFPCRVSDALHRDQRRAYRSFCEADNEQSGYLTMEQLPR